MWIKREDKSSISYYEVLNETEAKRKSQYLRIRWCDLIEIDEMNLAISKTLHGWEVFDSDGTYFGANPYMELYFYYLDKSIRHITCLKVR